MIVMRSRRGLLLVLFALALAGCSFRNLGCGVPKPADAPPSIESAPAAAARATTAGFKIAFLGDSLTAGLGLLSDQSFPALIQKLFETEGYDEVEVVNAGVSGDTTAGGLRRAPGVLESGVRILVLGLGGNDALRGLTTRDTHDNLAEIIQLARARGVTVFLCGMEAPPNLGEDYRANFRELFVQLIRENSGGVTFIPFLLEGVAGHPALNQADGIHPNQEGARVIAQALYPKLRTIVDQLGGGG
jgi:acyl-CoA thioesterase-1